MTERVTTVITCAFCQLWRGPEEQNSRLIWPDSAAKDVEQLRPTATVAGWSTVLIGDECVRAGQVLNICPICKDRALLNQELKIYYFFRDVARMKLGITTEASGTAVLGEVRNEQLSKGPW